MKKQVAEGATRRKKGAKLRPSTATAGARLIEKKEAAKRAAFPGHKYVEPSAGTGDLKSRKSEKALSAEEIIAKAKHEKEFTHPA
jgi:hypothetical protein